MPQANKKIKKTNYARLRFPTSMYNTPWGSIVICACLFSEKPDIKRIRHEWKTVDRFVENEMLKQVGENARFNFDDETKKRVERLLETDISDPDFIKKTLEYFGLEQPEVFPIAFVQSDVNALFAPYIDGKVYPLREDGLYTKTLQSGKIYPIDFKKEKKDD